MMSVATLFSTLLACCFLSSVADRHLVTNEAAAKLLPIDWLHIQKCGSSFGNTLLKWACFPNMTKNIVVPAGGKLAEMIKKKGCEKNFVIHSGIRKEWPIGDHFSLKTKEDGGDEGLEHVVTFLREPVERAVSHAFFYDKIFATKLKDISKHARNEIEERSRYEDALLKTRTAGGCHQTRFQVGRLTGSCEGTSQEACDRLPRLGFVGLASLWDSSICSFYNIYGRGPPSELELKNIRPGKAGDVYSIFPVLRDVFANRTADVNPAPEWPDVELYRCAVRQFAAQIKNTPCVAVAKEELRGITKGRARLMLEDALEALS